MSAAMSEAPEYRHLAHRRGERSVRPGGPSVARPGRGRRRVRRRTRCRSRTSRATSCGRSGWHIERRLRVRVRLPLSPSTMLISFDEPCVVTATRRRTLRSPGRRRFAPSGKVHATPFTHTRSIQPLSIAGWPDHQVGYTSTSVSHHRRSSPYDLIDGSVPATRWFARSLALNRRIEAVAVQIGQADLGTCRHEPGHDPVAGGGHERLLRRMAVHDERPGHRSSAICRSTRARNSLRCVSVDVSIA